MTQDVRLEQLTEWTHSLPGWEHAQLEVASADASFRRYFRARLPDRTAIVMDSPPDQENPAPFVGMTARLLAANVHAPALYAQNLLDGFLLLEDFGSTHLLDVLNADNADRLYDAAMQTLLKIQHTDVHRLAEYTPAFIRMELEIMPEWFLGKHLGFQASDIPSDLLDETFGYLLEEISHQPVAFMHRDFHSRNLMITATDSPGVIDYQGAFLGPVTYDLASLLRDCYIEWPEPRVEQWAKSFRREAIAAGTLPPVDEPTFLRWFDLMGLQRHIKVLGIFPRLHHRDGKSHYLHDLPRVLGYVMRVGSRYPQTARLIEWMRQAGIPERMDKMTDTMTGKLPA